MSETGGNYLFSHRTKKKKKCVYDLAISEKINGTDSPSEESNLNGVFNGEEHKKNTFVHWIVQTICTSR